MNFHDQAQYEAGSDEPVRTGQEAWQLYQAAGSEASSRLGIYLTARFVVQGVFIGDDRPWDEIVLVHMPSREGFQALLNDSTRQAGRYHRYAALADNYSIFDDHLSDNFGDPWGTRLGKFSVATGYHRRHRNSLQN